MAIASVAQFTATGTTDFYIRGGTGDTKTGDANWQVDHVYLSGELL